MVFAGDGTGSFTPIAAESNADVHMVDINRDTRPDTFLHRNGRTTATARVSITQPDGSFAPGEAFEIPATVVNVIAADFTNDGHNDLVITGVTTTPDGRRSHVFLAEALADGSFAPPQLRYTAASPIRDLAQGDFDGDGNVDIAFHEIVDQLTYTVTTFLGDGGGLFPRALRADLWTAPNDVTFTGRIRGLIAEDFADDARPELVVTQDSGEVHTMRVANGRLEIVQTFHADRLNPYPAAVTLRRGHRDLAVQSDRDFVYVSRIYYNNN